LCDRVVVLNFGEKLCEGLPQEVRNDRSVIDAYLGD
jgi:ABC-type branched-subunit amino acid transport system ATPase component